MTATYDRGPLVPYEITWRSGHVETIHAHAVNAPNPLSGDRDGHFTVYAEIDRRLTLLLSAHAAKVASIRRLPGWTQCDHDCDPSIPEAMAPASSHFLDCPVWAATLKTGI